MNRRGEESVYRDAKRLTLVLTGIALLTLLAGCWMCGAWPW